MKFKVKKNFCDLLSGWLNGFYHCVSEFSFSSLRRSEFTAIKSQVTLTLLIRDKGSGVISYCTLTKGLLLQPRSTSDSTFCVRIYLGLLPICSL